MNARNERADEASLGVTRDWDQCGDEFDDEDEYYDDEYEEDDDYDLRMRPEWLHPDCRNVCSALELGTCCMYPDNPLVRVAVDLADSVGRTVGGLGDVDCVRAGAELGRQFRLIPGLLAQIHAILPRLNKTAVSQLLCPVGRLGAALAQVCGGDCPWGCGNPAVPDRRAEFDPMIELVAECSTAIRVALGRHRRGEAPIVVTPRSAEGQGRER
jgi:hypothetical protein